MDEAFDELRVLAATDPRAARDLFTSILDEGGSGLDHLLKRLSAPGEGRLRQLAANTVRNRGDKDRLVPYLLRWLDDENDEFSRAAIAAALKDVNTNQHRDQRETNLPDLVDTYRYVAGRLCHRVRNALPSSSMQVRRIELLGKEVPEPYRGELMATVGMLKDAFRGLSRLVEFDTSDDYFRWRSVSFSAWLPAELQEYCAKNGSITLNIQSNAEPKLATIRANSFHLETIFWNLWKNAQQAVAEMGGQSCVVRVDISVQGGRVSLSVSDNGPGFPDALVGVAFEEHFSTRGVGRGRGLLEVADAVRRLSGHISLERATNGSFRINLAFPVEQT